MYVFELQIVQGACSVPVEEAKITMSHTRISWRVCAHTLETKSLASADMVPGNAISPFVIFANVACSNCVIKDGKVGTEMHTFVASLVEERRLPHHEFKSQHTKSPVIHHPIVRLLVNHLWWKIIQCAAECVSPLTRSMN